MHCIAIECTDEWESKEAEREAGSQQMLNFIFMSIVAQQKWYNEFVGHTRYLLIQMINFNHWLLNTINWNMYSLFKRTTDIILVQMG